MTEMKGVREIGEGGSIQDRDRQGPTVGAVVHQQTHAEEMEGVEVGIREKVQRIVAEEILIGMKPGDIKGVHLLGMVEEIGHHQGRDESHPKEWK